MKNGYFFLLIGLVAVSMQVLAPRAHAVNSINATFENTVSYTHYVPAEFIPGQVVPTGDNMADRPMELGGDEEAFLVENSSTVSGPALNTGNFMRIVDLDNYSAYGADFDFYDHSYDSGCVQVSWDVLFESKDYYFFYYRNGHADDPLHPSKSTIANIYTSGGFVMFQTKSGIVQSVPYEVGETIHFDTYLDLTNNRWAVVMNGELLFNNVQIMDAPFGRFVVGYGHDSDYHGAMQVDNVVMVPSDSCTWPEYSEECNEEVPTPVLTFVGAEDYSNSAGDFTRYRLAVSNWEDIPSGLFRQAPDLPPCGINNNSSRTWVDIYDGDGNRLYGFCALGNSNGLTKIWFARPRGQAPPPQVKIVLKDRLCDREYESNLVTITSSADGLCGVLPSIPIEVAPIFVESYNTPSGNFTRFILTVLNYEDIPQELFIPHPDVPYCENTLTPSRTWVEILDENGTTLQRFCSLEPGELVEPLWFVHDNSMPLPSSITVKLTDKVCNESTTSQPIELGAAQGVNSLKTLKITIHGTGKVVSTDGRYSCNAGNLTLGGHCKFFASYGDNITLKAIPINGTNYTSSFIDWGGACQGQAGNCTLSITSDTNVEAQFGAVGTPVTLQLDPPSGGHVFTYTPVVDPVLDNNASQCKPFAIGNLASGYLTLKVGLPPFTSPVDIYLGLQALAVSPFEVFLFKTQLPFGYTIVPYSSSGLVAWSKSTVNPVFQSFYGNIPVSALPKGNYTLYTLVTTAGNLGNYYLWVSTFEIK